ncbi:MAG: TIGR02757 family protein [Bacteroidota bacterium]
MKAQKKLRQFLDEQVERFNEPGFIAADPLSIPHQFSLRQDQEIMGFWVSILAWGQRKTIINNALRLIDLMDGQPYQFILNHQEQDRERFAGFKHRTFQYTDTLYFLEFLQWFYQRHDSLEDAFARFMSPTDETIEPALRGFHDLFFSLPDAPKRTRKHIATPARNSSCKRLNMFLRWMVRSDETGVDFGLWKSIQPAQLMMPLDVHVERIARRLGLIERKQRDWKTVVELTNNLRKLDPADPVKYDFALFGLGVLEKEEGWKY